MCERVHECRVCGPFDVCERVRESQSPTASFLQQCVNRERENQCVKVLNEKYSNRERVCVGWDTRCRGGERQRVCPTNMCVCNAMPPAM